MNEELVTGCAAALVLAAMALWSVAVIAIKYWPFGAAKDVELQIGLLIGAVLSAVFYFITAWRFAIGKGLAWGSFAFLLGVAPLLGFFVTANAISALSVIHVAVGTTLIIGVRGAWIARKVKEKSDYREVFD